MNQDKKLVIGWFSFACCEGCTILVTELLNTYLSEWKKVIEFRYFKILKSDNRLENLDVVFVEGAISSPTQEAELKKIRENCKYLVTVGACAVTGQPSDCRNVVVPEEINYKISWYLKHFDYSKEVKKIEDFVKVDDVVNGCPMDQKQFLVIMDKYLKLLKIN